MKKYSALFFDLDDTLFDSYHQCIMPAAKESCAAMIKAGLQCSLKEALEVRKLFIAENKKEAVFEHLCKKFGTQHGSSIVIEAGYKTFYQRTHVGELSPFKNVTPLLAELKTKYLLFLITQGHPPTQKLKVEKLKIQHFFDNIQYTNSVAGENKKTAFQKIIAKLDVMSKQILCIGNRLDNEISYGNQLGCDTCWVRWGEQSHVGPKDDIEVPLFTVNKIGDLIQTCHL